MSKRHYIPKRALKRVGSTRFQKKPLTYAVALALISGAALPATGWTATIEGYKFVDRDRDGVKDSSEVGLAGEKFKIKSTIAPATLAPIPFSTDSEGRFVYNPPSIGSYRVWEDLNEESVKIVSIQSSSEIVTVYFPVESVAKVLTQSISEVKTNKLVSFTILAGASDPTPFQVNWDFGDGQTTTMEAVGNPLTSVANHSYSTAGDFTVTATITYQDGTTEVLTTTIKVKVNSNPIIKITAPISSGESVEIKAGDNYSLEATLIDLDAEDNHQIYYSISDGSNYIWQQNAVTAPYALSVPFTISDNTTGMLSAYVSAYDQDWAWVSDSVTLSSLGIKITAPTGDTLQNLESAQPVEFKAVLTDLKDIDKHNVYWYFGDSGWKSWKQLAVEGNPAETTVSYAYAGGDFTVQVYAYDNDWKRWTFDKVTVHVNGPVNSNPTAEIISATLTGETTANLDLAATPVKLERGQTVNFKIKIDDVDTWNQLQAGIDFGDGGWEQITVPEGSSLPYVVEVSHTYLGGNFTLYAYIYDDKGGWTQTSLPLEVSGEPNANPIVDISLASSSRGTRDGKADITTPGTVYVGVPFKLDVSISDFDINTDPLRAYWYFGMNESIYGEQEISNPASYSLYHTYEVAGEKVISVDVRDNNGGWGRDEETVMVSERIASENSPVADICDITQHVEAPNYLVVESNDLTWDSSNHSFTNQTVLVVKEGAIATFSTSTLDPSYKPVKAICNMGTLVVSENNILVRASTLIANYASGVIKGVNGYDGGSTVGGEGVTLQFSVSQDVIGGECPLTPVFFNEGIIRAGRGGHAYTDGGKGGDLNIEADCDIEQNGFLIAGDGGTADAVPLVRQDNDYARSTQGGAGGNIYINAKDFLSGIVSVTEAGKGGDARAWYTCIDSSECVATSGEVGNTTIVPKGTFSAEGTFTGKSLYAEPDIMFSGKGTHIVMEEDVVIFGGDGWKLQLNDLRDDAIKAGRDIILAVGKDGIVDLRGNTSQILKAGGKLKIYSDNILLDEGVTLADLVDATEIEVNPAKILYHVTFVGPSEQQVKPNTVTLVKVALANVGPTADTYTLRLQRVKKDIDPKILKDMIPPFMPANKFKVLEDVTNTQDWKVAQLPATVTVEGLKKTDLTLNITSPATLDQQETLVITAVSQTDPSVKTTFEVDVKVAEQTQRVLIDSDNDGVADEFDAFPNDAKEWMDTDHDKVANNSDEDDDGDGMPDEWEQQYNGLYSTRYDAEGDQDQDGYTNLEEYKANTNPLDFSSYPGAVVETGPYSIHGTLLNKAGKPLANVTVQVGDKTTTTDNLGNWEVSGLFEGTYDVFAIKNNFSCSKSDVELGNQEFSTEINCEPVNALKVFVKPQTSGAVKQGDEQTYLITVVNGGQQTASGVTLIETLPEGSEWVALEALDGGVCDANTLTCTLADLTPGVTARFKLVLRHPTAKTLKNVVTVTSNEYPIEVKTNWQKVKPYLSLMGQSVPNPVEMGKTIHYQLTAELLNNSPQTTAESVMAEIILPTEVRLLGATATQGTCERVDNKVVCQLGNLGIANSDDVSRVTIDIEVELADLGLLQLSAETRVYANNLPEHRDVIRTTLILADVQVDGAILLDVTGSMGEELQAVIKIVQQKLTEQYTGGKNPLIALVSFRDSVKLEAVSTDLNVLLKALGKLEAKGGGLCAEASAEALTLALNHVKPGGTIVFASDAPPYDGTDIQALKAKIAEKQAVFIPILTKSDCAANELAQ